jgi:hypothetical protein
VFQLASSLTQLRKLVDVLGGAKDTTEHRHKIGEVNGRIQAAAKQVKQQMTGLHAARETLSEAEQLKAKKLLQDFTALLQVPLRPHAPRPAVRRQAAAGAHAALAAPRGGRGVGSCHGALAGLPLRSGLRGSSTPCRRPDPPLCCCLPAPPPLPPAGVQVGAEGRSRAGSGVAAQGAPGAEGKQQACALRAAGLGQHRRHLLPWHWPASALPPQPRANLPDSPAASGPGAGPDPGLAPHPCRSSSATSQTSRGVRRSWSGRGCCSGNSSRRRRCAGLEGAAWQGSSRVVAGMPPLPGARPGQARPELPRRRRRQGRCCVSTIQPHIERTPRARLQAMLPGAPSPQGRPRAPAPALPPPPPPHTHTHTHPLTPTPTPRWPATCSNTTSR